jgi:ATP-binding cassette subfamily B protein
VEGGVAASAGVVVLIVGGAAVAQRTMTLGDLLSFYAVLALLLRQVNIVVANVPLVMYGDEALRRLDEILEAKEPEPYRGRRALPFRGSLALEEVSFRYADDPVLDGVTLRIEPGERVALVGPNGAGKSTVLRLMLGLYRPHAGRLTADGVPYDDLNLANLRRQIAVVLQDPVIFPATIRENISYGRPGATDEDIRRAAELATADFVDLLPGGLDTDVGDEGGLLSGGQGQKIAIARALLGHPRLLVLDEPTTYLDGVSSAHLMRNLRALPGDPALLFITHDPDVSRHADTLYELRHGRIATVADSARVAASQFSEVG